MNKIVSVLFMVIGIAFAISTAVSVPLPTDRLSFIMIMYFEAIAVGMFFTGYFSFRKALNSEFGVVIFQQ